MDDYVQIARRCADFLLAELTRDGTVLRTWRDGSAKIVGFLEDVAFLADALFTLYEATGEPAYFGHAERLCGDIVERYLDPVAGFCDTAIDGEPLLIRPHTLDDNAVPAGQSMAAHALLRLSAFTGAVRWRDAALRAVGPLAEAVSRSPLSLGNLAWAHQLAALEGREVAIAGSAGADDTRVLLRVVRRYFDPVSVLAWGEPNGVPLLADRPARDGRATAYVCRGFVCDAPVSDPDTLRAQLEASAGNAAVL